MTDRYCESVCRIMRRGNRFHSQKHTNHFLYLVLFGGSVTDYRFPESTRKNNPPAKIAAEGYVPILAKAQYSYRPRRPPELGFDPTGRADELPDGAQRLTAGGAHGLEQGGHDRAQALQQRAE